MRVRLELSGGLELLFGGKKEHELDLPAPPPASANDATAAQGGGDAPSQAPWTVGQLILWVKDTLLVERPELFVKGNSVRPGILVLINDCDWELSGMLDAQLTEGDVVTFISTLHGG